MLPPCDISVMLCASRESTPTTMQDQINSRRSNKPQMERRRRERINQCLNELKNLVLTAQKKDPSRYNKLEKADILEMTVRHVQTMHHPKSQSPKQQDKYYAGYTRCATEVAKFLEGASGIPEDLRKHITSHLNTPTVTNPPRLISLKPESNTVTTSVTVNPPTLTLNPGSCSNKQLQQQVGTPLNESQMSVLLPISGRRVTPTGSSHSTNATSPEATGTPASPESAHGSSPQGVQSPGSNPSVSTYIDHTRVQIKPDDSCLNVETPVRLPQPGLQNAPLDLAVNRRDHNEPSLPNEYKCQRRLNNSLKVVSLPRKNVRFVPYVHQNIPQNNIHWRPW